MKTIISLTVLFFFLPSLTRAQSDSSGFNKFYHTWIIPEKGYKGKSGVLYEIKDSAVLVSNSPWIENYRNGNFDVARIDIRKIDEIRVRRQGAGYAVLVGGITGAVVGVIISAAYMDHLEKTMNPIGFAFGGFFQGILPFIVSTGVGIGVGIAVSPKRKIQINGSQDTFNRNKINLNKYALVQHSAPELFSGKSFGAYRDTLVDHDGNVYHTLVLGGQVWMAENLKVKHFSDGSPIQGLMMQQNEVRYNWMVVNDSRKLCPAGWHVPAITEWTSLYNSLGGEQGAAARLEEGFTNGLPIGQWWSSTPVDSLRAQSFYLNAKTFGVIFTSVPRSSVVSVRCIRNN